MQGATIYGVTGPPSPPSGDLEALPRRVSGKPSLHASGKASQCGGMLVLHPYA
jgi:hypothetical protein